MQLIQCLTNLVRFIYFFLLLQLLFFFSRELVTYVHVCYYFLFYVHTFSFHIFLCLVVISTYFYLLHNRIKRIIHISSYYSLVYTLLFFIFFAFFCFYISGLAWSIEFWYGNFWTFAFFEYLLSDVRVFFCTIVLFFTLVYATKILKFIQITYLKFYYTKLIKYDIHKFSVTNLQIFAIIKKRVILLTFASCVGYFLFPSFKLNTFHWYSVFTWTFNYEILNDLFADKNYILFENFTYQCGLLLIIFHLINIFFQKFYCPRR